MHPIPALSVAALSELKTAVEYVGLGHTHKHYEIDNWAFNPGSIEITNIAEFRENRGAFVVEVDEQNNLTAKHVTDYHFRPFQQLPFQVTGFSDAKAITEKVLEMVRAEARIAEHGLPQPIIEISLRGQLGFPNSLLEIQKMRDETKAITDALHVRIKNHSVPADFFESSDETEDAGREHLERRVIDDLVLRDNRFKSRVSDISEAIIGAKRMALGDDEPAKIAEFIGLKTVTDDKLQLKN